MKTKKIDKNNRKNFYKDRSKGFYITFWGFLLAFLVVGIAGAVSVLNDNGLTTPFTSSETINTSSINTIVYVKQGNSSDLFSKLNSISAGGTIMIPSGIYSILTPLNFSSEVRMIGAGIGNTIIFAGVGFSGDAIIRPENLTTDNIHVKIEGMSLDCNNRVDYGMWLNTTKVSNIRDVRTDQCEVAGFFLDQDNFYTRLSDITEASSTLNGILILDNEVFIDNARISAPIGINITSGNNILIERASIDGVGIIGIWLDDVDDVDLIGNRYEGYEGCINITANADNVRIIGGRFSNCGSDIGTDGNDTLQIKDDDITTNGIITSTNAIVSQKQAGTSVIQVKSPDGTDWIQIASANTVNSITSVGHALEFRADGDGRFFFNTGDADNRIILRDAGKNDSEIRNGNGTVQIGDGTGQMNITLTSPDGTEFDCGVNDSGSYLCS